MNSSAVTCVVKGRSGSSRQSGQSVEAAGIDDRAGQDVGPDFGALLDHHDRDVPARLRGELLQADGRGKARRARPDDDHVEFHRFTGGQIHK